MSEANVPDGWATRRSIALTALSAVAGSTALLRLLGEPDSASGRIGGGDDDTTPRGTTPGNGGGGGGGPEPTTTDDGGLGDGDGGLPSAPAPGASVSVAPEDREWGFMEPLVWIETGGTVTWTVIDADHTVVAYHPDNDRPPRVPAGSGPWNSTTKGPEETFARTFDVPGVYDYFCASHEDDGAVGTVVVGQPSTDPSEEPGLSEPQADLPTEVQRQLGLLNDLATEMLRKSGSTSG